MTMITPSYLGETIEYSSLHACRSTLEDPTRRTFLGRFGPAPLPDPGSRRGKITSRQQLDVLDPACEWGSLPATIPQGSACSGP